MTIDNSPSSLPRGLSIIVPVYNSRSTLEQLHTQVCSVCESLKMPFELILVDDGSQDESWRSIDQIARDDARVHGIRMMRNYGQHNAVICGVRSAKFDVTVTMDDDLQHPPKHIPLMLEKLNQGFDVVYGRPRKRRHSTFRNLVTKIVLKFAAAVLGIASIEVMNAYRAFRTDLRSAFDDFNTPGPILDALLSWGTSKFAIVEIEHETRKVGQSNYTLFRLINQTLYLLTAFSTFPLRLTTILGMLFIVFGGGVMLYVIGRYLLESSVPGFPFIASIITIFSGAQLFALGMLGEYLAHVFQRSMGRPAYIVAERVSSRVEPDVNGDGDQCSQSLP